MRIVYGIFVYSWIVSMLFGFIVSISYPIFINYYDDSDRLGCFIPLYNLFNLCGLNGYDEKMGFLFLIPIINVVMIMFMSFKLKDTFGTDMGFGIGLLLLPYIFVPVLAYTKVNENSEDEEEIDDKKKKNKKDTEEPEEEFMVEDNENDSIFRLQRKTKEYDNKPYKAKRVKVNEQFINSAPAEEEKIDRLNKES